MTESRRNMMLTKQQLRSKAEMVVVNAPPTETRSSNIGVLQHELDVYHIELEMQNESLIKMHLELLDQRDLHLDMYEFAPVAYLSLSTAGMISRSNLTSTTLLGVDHGSLLGRNLINLIIPADQDRWTLFQRMVRNNDGHFHSELNFIRSGSGTLCAKVDATRRKMLTGDYEIRVCLSEVGNIELEKREIYASMVNATQHILNNLLNQLQVIKTAAKKSADFDKVALHQLDEMMDEASGLVGELSNVIMVTKDNIKNSIAPK